MSAQQPFETSVAIYQSTRRNVIAHFVLVIYPFLFLLSPSTLFIY